MADDRDLWVRIKADVGSLMGGLTKASAAVRNFDKELATNERKRQGLEQLGTAYRNIALGAGIGLAAVVKSAMDWESAWAGVSKTVNGSTEELAKLEGQLREMARTMPATHQEIAAVAEAAGQLGVATSDVAAFTEIMVQLGETTNLTADEAAMSLAQLMNVMQTAPEDVDNLGAAVVALGNDGASTERDIVQMAQNIAGAGKTVGLTETDVLGLANALASVGIEAEAGGSSVSRILIDMAKAAKTGSPDLARFAKASGVTAAEFKNLIDTAPAEAFNVFTQGLGRINKEGGDVYTLLEDLGQSDVRVTRALLGMANSGDLLTDSLKLGSEAFEENTALADEYAKRAKTSAAKAQVAWNGIKDNLIDIGAEALPVVVELSEAVSDLTGFFSDLPKPVQAGVVKMLALTTVLAGGLYMVTKARLAWVGLASSLEATGAAAEGSGRKMALMRGGAGIAGIALLSFADAAEEAYSGAGDLFTILGGASVGFAIGGPLGAAAGALLGVAKASGDASVKFDSGRASVKEYAATFDGLEASITAATRSLVVQDLQKTNAFGAAKAAGISSRDLVGYVLNEKDAVKRVNAALAEQYELLSQGKAAMVDLANGGQVDAFNALAQSLGLVTDEFDKGRQEALEAATAAATWKQALAGVPKEVQVELENLNYEPTKQQIDDLVLKYNLTPEQVSTILTAIDQATPKINTVRGGLDALNGKVSTVTIRTIKETFFVTRGSDPKPSVRDMLNWAEGGVVDFYGNGGVRENHVAQIAPAGAWRVWAEPETGGEGYIPLAPGPKRKRALEVHAEVGRRIGAVGYANGGINGGSSSTGGSHFTGDLYLDSGEFLGKVRGIARDESAGAVRLNARYEAAGRRKN